MLIPITRHKINFLTYLTRSLNYRPKFQKSRFLEMPFLGMLTSQIFAGLSILTSKMNPENFRSISQRLTNAQKSWSVKFRMAHKIRTRSRDVTKFTGWCNVIYIYHWPSVKSFWWVELKSAFYKGQTRARILRDFSISGLRCINFWLNGNCNENILYST